MKILQDAAVVGNDNGALCWYLSIVDTVVCGCVCKKQLTVSDERESYQIPRCTKSIVRECWKQKKKKEKECARRGQQIRIIANPTILIWARF